MNSNRNNQENTHSFKIINPFKISISKKNNRSSSAELSQKIMVKINLNTT